MKNTRIFAVKKKWCVSKVAYLLKRDSLTLCCGPML